MSDSEQKIVEFVKEFTKTVRELIKADPEFVYVRPGGGDRCVYAIEEVVDEDDHRLCGSCLFGQVAEKMGFLDLAHAREGNSISSVIDNWANSNIKDGGHEFHYEKLLAELQTAAQSAQYAQDAGLTWGEAGARFEVWVSRWPILNSYVN